MKTFFNLQPCIYLICGNRFPELLVHCYELTLISNATKAKTNTEKIKAIEYIYI